MTDTQKPESQLPPSAPSVEGIKVEASELFAGQKEVLIIHDGVVYRLRITRRNKLILQK